MPFDAFAVTVSGRTEYMSTCPRHLISWREEMWLRLYAHYKNGFLYRDGGVRSQPALYLSVMELIDAEVNTQDQDDG